MSVDPSAIQPARPLVIRFGALGDMVIVTALVKRLAERYGTAVDLLGSGAWTRALLDGQPDVGVIHILPSRKTPYWLSPAQWRTVAMLRAHRGPVFMCDDTAQTHALLARAGRSDEDMVDGYGGFQREHLGRMHWLEQWRVVAERAPPAFPAPSCENPPPLVPRLVVSAAQRQAFVDWRAGTPFADAPLVLLQPGNKRTLKRGRLGALGHHKHWPAERWADVARAVLADLPGAQVLVCGVPAEHAVVEDIVTRCDRRRVHNLARDLPLPRLMALAEAAHSMISVDSGPAHLAATVGCPLLVMFGGADPRRWCPVSVGAPVLPLGGAPEGIERVSEIATERVVEAWRTLRGAL